MTTKGAPTSEAFFHKVSLQENQNRKGLRRAPALRGEITLLALLALCLGSSPLRGHVELPLEEEEEEEEEKGNEETRETSDEPSFATKIAAVAVGRPSNPTSVPHHQRQ